MFSGSWCLHSKSLTYHIEKQPLGVHDSSNTESTPISGCSGGDRRANIELVADNLVKTGSREQVNYHAELMLHRGDNVGVAWTAQIVDDRGRVIQANLALGATKLRRGLTTKTDNIAKQLEDGFYTLQVKAITSTGDEPDELVEAHQHVHVANGKWIELDDIEWRKQSQQAVAFSEADIEKMVGRTM